jgi:hypothetical protein
LNHFGAAALAAAPQRAPPRARTFSRACSPGAKQYFFYISQPEPHHFVKAGAITRLCSGFALDVPYRKNCFLLFQFPLIVNTFNHTKSDKKTTSLTWACKKKLAFNIVGEEPEPWLYQNLFLPGAETGAA